MKRSVQTKICKYLVQWWMLDKLLAKEKKQPYSQYKEGIYVIEKDINYMTQLCLSAAEDTLVQKYIIESKWRMPRVFNRGQDIIVITDRYKRICFTYKITRFY